MKADVAAQWRDILRTNTVAQEVLREMERNQPKAYKSEAGNRASIEQTALSAAYAQGYADCLARLRGIAEGEPASDDSPFISFNETDHQNKG